jgi:hypothetical protein
MGEVASAYRELDKHGDALAMFQKQLEFNSRVLPQDHPDIGEGLVRSGAACAFEAICCCLWRRAGTAMGEVALSFRDLERHADSLAMFQKELDFNRRTLPEDHPAIGEINCGVMHYMCF